MIDLIISLDYEVFGNGSGDVRLSMIEPTRRLMSVCEPYGAKISIMFEVGEYWAMERAEEEGSLGLSYAPSRDIAAQVREAARRGHDVQLHVHPWWVDASFETGRWRLHPEFRRITDLPNGLGGVGDPLSVVGVLSEGKRTLDDMIRPVYADYQCLVYRAAMFWGQPSGDLIKGLKKVGLIADTSVVSGLHETMPVPTDYRRAVSNAGYWWTGADDVAQPGPKGENIIELPVHSQMQPYLCNLKWTKLATTLKRRRVERDNAHGHGMMEARQSTEPLGQVVRKLCSRRPVKYDFCKFSGREMICWLQRLMAKERHGGEGVHTPVVMLGHSKDFWNERNLDTFLRFVRRDCEGRVRFSTLAEVVKRIVQEDEDPREMAAVRPSGTGG